MRVAIARLAAIGLSPTHILWQQGETDNLNGTTALAYTTSLQALVQSIRDLGVNAPFFVALGTYISGAASPTVRSGQSASVSAPLNIIQGPDTDTLTGANRMADETHFTETGLDAQADLWIDVLLDNL
jgi:hypothetical protein